MPITAEHLRRHYASLSDEELMVIDPAELTEMARKCYDLEMDDRGLLVPKVDVAEEQRDENASIDLHPAGDFADDDFGDGATFAACSFLDLPGAAEDAEEARHALQAAGIPCRIEEEVTEAEPARPQGRLLQVVVPSEQTLLATSLLDRDFYNPRMEADWKAHLSDLTDDQFARINPDAICLGLLDRAARLRKAYLDEVHRRNMESRSSSAD
jgi:hypothetical protein